MTEFLDSLNFLWELFKRDLKKKYYKSVLGVLWTLLNPLLMMLVMTLIFSTLFRRSIEHYPVYYLCAYILLNFNNVATSQALGCLPANGGLLRKIHVPAYLFCPPWPSMDLPWCSPWFPFWWWLYFRVCP